MDKTRIRKIAVRTWLISLPIQFSAAYFTFETIGEVTCGIVVVMTICFNIIALPIFFRWFYPGIICVLVSLSYGAILVGYQAHLGVRMYFVRSEARSIVSWAYAEHEQTGKFPKDLTGYVVRYPSYQGYLQGYHSNGEEQMSVSYYVGTPNTSHYYSTEQNGWGYYPD
jgi:hypothetical protein